MAQIDLENLDTPNGIDQLDAGFVLWLSNVVDVLNRDIDIIQDAFNNLLTITTIDIGGSGASVNVTQLGLTPTGSVTAVLLSSTNPVTILSVTPGTGSFNVTFSGDPGASAIIKYSAYTAQP